MDIHLLKFLISLSLFGNFYCSELVGRQYDNFNTTSQRETLHQKYNDTISENDPDSEEIPDPSPLIIPGYNLPGHLFNNGKPFYVEKDPLTGAFDFNNQKSAGKEYNANDYEYIDEEPSDDIFDKANIDRKDGGYGSHRPNDVNQLSPNFHDFLNLPVKYNPEKYVYPLISSSYANTKIQGNVNSYNHKQYSATTYKPTVSPMYYSTKSPGYYRPTQGSTTERTTIRTTTTPSTTTSTTAPSTTTKATDNLMNSPMNHPSYLTTVENDYDYDYYTTRMSVDQGVYLTTEPPRKNIFITNKPQISSTTKKPYSIFDELFGDYEEPEPMPPPMKLPSLFTNLPSTTSDNKYYDSYDKVTQPPSYTQSTSKPYSTYSTTKRPVTESVSQVYPENEENNMYEYEDDYNNNYHEETEIKKNITIVEPSTMTPIVKNETSSGNSNNKTQNQSNSHQNFLNTRFQNLPQSFENEQENTYYPSSNQQNIQSQNIQQNSQNQQNTQQNSQNQQNIQTQNTAQNSQKQQDSYSQLNQQQNQNIQNPQESTYSQSQNELQNSNSPSQNQQKIAQNQQENSQVQNKNQNSQNTQFQNNRPQSQNTRPQTQNIQYQNAQSDNIKSENSQNYNIQHFQGNQYQHFQNSEFLPYPNNQHNYLNFQNTESQNPANVIPENQQNYTDNIVSITERQDNNLISITSEKFDYYDNDDYNPKSSSKLPEKYTEKPQNLKVTSMPLGENHPPNARIPIFTLTQNLKESLNREKVETTTKTYINPSIPFEKKENVYTDHKSTVLHAIPSTSNIHIAPDQDVVSFVVGNHQNVDGGHYIGSAVKEEAYLSNSFKPLYNQQNSAPTFDQVIFNRPVQNTINFGQSQNHSSFHDASTSINVQPIKGLETSLSIGIPANDIKTIPGQVVDEKLEITENIEYPKEPGTKIVFPEDDVTTQSSQNNKDILSLYSRPMFHQLPADLTPPSEPEIKIVKTGSPRPPWDPRPGHFYQGRPEYARPPRPPKPEIYKRIDGLPNILPQFRPNAKVSNGHYMDSVGTINAGYMPRQPLLDRPSNRPIGFFEKLHPPPPPKRIHDLRKVTAMEQEQKHDRYRYEERILNVPNPKPIQEQYYQTPPKVSVANRKSEDETEIATLQMIQAKQSDKLDTITPNVPPPFKITYQTSTTEKPLYVVYPVNSAPLKLDVLDNDNRETVVVGTRGEQLPLPPSKINQELAEFEQKPILKPKDRNDAPILKPHSRPNSYPVKSDFPYILERPDPTLMNIPIPHTSTDLNQDTTLSADLYNNDYMNYQSNNQWTSLDTEARIVNGNKINAINSDQISATLKTYTEKPIAIAYTPTEPSSNKYAVPNFGRPMMTEIRNPHHPGTVTNNDSEFTVSAVMHTHPQIKHKNENKYYNTDQQRTPIPFTTTRKENIDNHKLNLDIDTTHIPAKLDFQAPFHASVSVDSQYQGWAVVNNHQSHQKSEIDRSDVDVASTNLPVTSSSGASGVGGGDFDIENFKPQLFGGFKPIYSFPEKEMSSKESERQE